MAGRKSAQRTFAAGRSTGQRPTARLVPAGNAGFGPLPGTELRRRPGCADDRDSRTGPGTGARPPARPIALGPRWVAQSPSRESAGLETLGLRLPRPGRAWTNARPGGVRHEYQ